MDLYEIVREVDAALAARKVPFPVVYGPERTESTTWAEERVVIQHPRVPGTDTLEGPRGLAKNPRAHARCHVGAVAHIYARSPLAGAGIHDHERRARAVLDRLYVALDKTIRGAGSPWAATGGGFIVPPDAEGSSTWGGVIYELPFTYERAMQDRAWSDDPNADGAARPVGTLGGLSSTTKVSFAGDPESESAPPPELETACGA